MRPIVVRMVVGLGLIMTSSMSAQGFGGLGGGGPATASSGHCKSAADHAAIHETIANWQIQQASAPEALLGPFDTPQALQRYPTGALFREDMAISNYVDLDTAPGAIQDFNCGTVTYDGHDASDALIRTFDEQVIGVPVYAVADGVVIDTHDGEPDMNTVAAGQLSNYVIVDHGLGHLGWYWHLKLNSVSVSLGQSVTAGEEIGRVGSSGNSNWPHLHFAYTDGQQPIEPFAGACNAGPSHWAHQPAIPTQTGMWDCGISRTSPATGAPLSLPRDRHVLLTDPVVYIWFHLSDLPANTSWRFIFEQPNGTVDFDSGTGNFGNPQWGSAFYWFNWGVTNMQTIQGTWTVRVLINGIELAAMPIEVVATLPTNPNLPPEPITVTIDPAVPSADEALRCRVTSTHLLDDRDWDVVRHRFHWKVNGNTARDVTLGCRADMLPRTAFSPGDVVTCDVTPGDGSLWGPVAQAGVTISPGYMGTGEDLELRTGIDSLTATIPHIVPVHAGDTLLVSISSPNGAFVGVPPFLAGQLFTPGSPPATLPTLPTILLDLTSPMLVLFSGFDSTPLGPILLPPGGMSFQFAIPTGLTGQSLMLQNVAVTPTAANGVFASSNGKEIRFL